ncbi:MAG: ribonuclease P protein component [Alphaproteobacteria bacterium]|nr:ribonuclease P protein component [Alphaproteobacteria bacterium]
MPLKSLKRHFDFVEMRDAPFKAFSRTFVLQMRPNTLNVTRFGFTVSKKISKLATKRNYLRRTLREIVRHHPSVIQDYPSNDFVLIARKEALERSYQELARDFDYILAHLHREDTHEI